MTEPRVMGPGIVDRDAVLDDAEARLYAVGAAAGRWVPGGTADVDG